MESSINDDTPLDYATIQIFPAQNRYEFFVCGDDEVEKIAIGSLEQLLPHLPEVANLNSNVSKGNLKLQVAGLDDTTWFTKSTLNRFLRIISSKDFVNSTKLIEDEMSQLEEAKKFHLSIHAQECKDHFGSGGTDGCSSTERVPSLKPEVKIASSNTSKDELLRAMDLRLTALRRELAAALNTAGGLTCSAKDTINVIRFCDHFGATDLKNTLCKFFEPSCKSEKSVLMNDDKHSSTCMSTNDNASKTNGDTKVPRSTHLETPVKYGVSPVMVAQVERQSSTESDESLNLSDDNEIIAERSRALTRSALPRRSASPMRRVQIGRTGSRRAPALTIKSLGHYPARERAPLYRDAAANSSEEEGSEQTSKKPENNVRRLTVQDAINLFESKQKDESADAKKRSSSSNLSLCTKKSVLRRWSASTAECSVPHQPAFASLVSVQLYCNDVMDLENSNHSLEHLVSDFKSGCQNPSEATEFDMELTGLERRALELVDAKIETYESQERETNATSAVSAVWSGQAEVKSSHVQTKMMESRPVKTRKPQSHKNQNIPSEHRGGFYDHYKEKRDEKLRQANARKKAAKEAQFSEMCQTLDKRKAEMAPSCLKDASKKHPAPKLQNVLKNPSQPANPRNESPKASVTRKVSSKTSALPATRKSWPSAPSTRVVGPSPSKTSPGISSGVATRTLRKPLATSPVVRSRAKVERSQPPCRNLEESQTDADRTSKVIKEKQQMGTKHEKTTKTKVATGVGNLSSNVPSKPSLYNKMTKKGSVVPLESKPFLRKGSGVAPVIGSMASKKKSSQLEETSIHGTLKSEVAFNPSILVIQREDQDAVPNNHANAALEPELQVNNHQNCTKSVTINGLTTNDDNVYKATVESSAKIQSLEEPGISPIAWEEIDDCQNVHSSYNDVTPQLASPVLVVPPGLSSPRVRHSLSQMLQEESSETDTSEWGNAENPPAMPCQKDAPKGLQRLLKFARKSKGEANVTGGSSPSVFSEGEEDAEESKAVSKRDTDNLLRKAALHSKNYGKQDISFFAGNEKNSDAQELYAESNLSKFGVQSSHTLQKSDVSTAASTTKATRLFFSLSAFRGSKPNETKI